MNLNRGIMPIPQSFTQLRDSEASIFVFSGSDRERELHRKLGIEWASVPLLNRKYDENTDGAPDTTSRVLLVYILRFFNDETDFAYMIKDGAERTKFFLGTYSGKAYDRPCFATPITVFEFEEIRGSDGLSRIWWEEASKTETKGLKWKYLYESGVEAWQQLEFSAEKRDAIKQDSDEFLAAWRRQQASDPEPPSSPPSTGKDMEEADVRSDYGEDMQADERAADSDTRGGDSGCDDDDEDEDEDGDEELESGQVGEGAR